MGGLNRFIAPQTLAVLLHMLVHILGCQFRSNGQQLRIEQYRPDQSWTRAGSINGSGRVTKCSDVHGSGQVGSTVQNMLCDNKVHVCNIEILQYLSFIVTLPRNAIGYVSF